MNKMIERVSDIYVLSDGCMGIRNLERGNERAPPIRWPSLALPVIYL